MSASDTSKSRELRLFLFSTLLPALLGLAAAVWGVRTAWQKMLADERLDLQSHAEWIADALMARVHAAGLGDPFPQHRAARRPPAPRHLKEDHPSPLSPGDIAPLCDAMRGTGRARGTAFDCAGRKR